MVEGHQHDRRRRLGRCGLELGRSVRRNRAAAGYDRTHVFQMGWVYELPMGTGKAIANSGIVKHVVGNWQVNGVMSAYTGTPFTVGTGTALNMPNNINTANQVKTDVQRIGGAGPGQLYYDTSAFAAGPTNTLGSTGRNILRNPGRMEHGLEHLPRVPHQGEQAVAVPGGVSSTSPIPLTSADRAPASVPPRSCRSPVRRVNGRSGLD